MSREHVMVAVDFGPESDHAFEAAIELASRLQAVVDVVHICTPPPTEEAEDPPYVAAARAHLERLVERARLEGLHAEAHLKAESTIFGLLELIDELAPRLVVVGSHGRKGVGRALLGSISDALAHRSPVPVLIVPTPVRHRSDERAAWSCAACGHILGDAEPRFACGQCGATPASWETASIEPGPVDVDEPAVGESVAADLSPAQTYGTVGLFATSPPGTNATDVNPELRVRY